MIFYTHLNYDKCLNLPHPARSHGRSTSPMYRAWTSMKQRCINKNSKMHYNYGARGIGICERWLRFENFLEDMNERPAGMEIDRIDSNLGYYKDNCRWVKPNTNRVNRRRAIKSNLPRGVSLSKNKKRYKAFITVNYKQISLGTHDTAELAHEEYRKKAMEVWGIVPDYAD